MNTDHGLTGPWIVCGTYNSGLLAGFARQKYSHIFHAAYSSSGQMEALVDFFGNVSLVLKKRGFTKNCFLQKHLRKYF